MGSLWRILCLVLAAVLAATFVAGCDWEDGEWPGARKYCNPAANLRTICIEYFDIQIRQCVDRNSESGKTYYKYNLTITIRDPQEENLFAQNLGNYKDLTVLGLFLEGGSLTTVPKEVLQLNMVKELTVKSKLTSVNFNDFVSMSLLNKIYLADNAISVIETDEIIGKINVQTVDISYNLIEDIPNYFSKHFSMLRHLNITHNKISNIGVHAFEGLVQLETVNLSHNNIYKVGDIFKSLSNLQELSMSNNNLVNINSVNFETLVNLEKLNISSNNISVVDSDTFSSLKNLQVLDLTANKIIAITKQLFVNNVNLQSLSLCGNPLQSIEGYSFGKTRLTNLQLTTRYLTVIEKGTYKGAQALTLDFSGGNLINIKDEAFSGMTDLNNLNLSSNAVETISPLAFKSLTSLNILDLSHNKLKELNINSDSLTNLKKLFANDNKIEKLDKNVFANLVSLEELYLSFNPLKHIKALSTLNKLKTLVLRGNMIDILEYKSFEGLSSLQTIEMSLSRTTIFQNESFSGLSFLTTVISAYGNLEIIEYNAFLGSNSIEFLNLTSNRLQMFDVNTTTLSNIKEIYLNENRIKVIDSKMFRFSSLVALSLANNDISDGINSDSFKYLDSLQYINLSSNPEMLIPTNAFQNLDELYALELQNIKRRISFENSSSSAQALLLQSCGITDLNDVFVYNLQSLRYLNVAINEITYINKATFKNMPNLINLDLSQNKISHIQPGSFQYVPRLRGLILDMNRLQEIQFGVFKGLNELGNLRISKNTLQSLDVKLLPELYTLALDYNQLTHIDIQYLLKTKLSSLNITGNPLSCEFLAEIKASNLSKAFNRIVKIGLKDYYSENVDGLPCRRIPTYKPVREKTIEDKLEALDNKISNISNDVDYIKDQLRKISAVLLKPN